MTDSTIDGTPLSAIEAMPTRRRRRFVFASSNRPSEAEFTAFKALVYSDPDERIRTYAVRGIARTHHVAGPDLLLELARSRTRPTRVTALSGLIGQARRDQVDELSKLVEDDDRAVRSLAIQVLAKTGAKPAVAAVIPALKDENRTVRFRAAEALGELADPSSLPALDQAIARESGMNRFSMRRVRAELATKLDRQ